MRRALEDPEKFPSFRSPPGRVPLEDIDDPEEDQHRASASQALRICQFTNQPAAAVLPQD